MTNKSPFDHRPDPELGRALRGILDAGDHPAFVRRVVAAADRLLGRGAEGEWWSVVLRWARPSLAAAVLVWVVGSLFALGMLQREAQGVPGLGDPLATADGQLGVPAFFASSPAPRVDEVLAVAVGH